MAVPYTRQFRYGDRGPDVEGVGRALARSRTKGNTSWLAFTTFPKRIRRTWGKRKQADLRRFKKAHGLKADFAYTKEAHAKLSPFFDAKARRLMGEYDPPPPPGGEHWIKLVAAMKDLDAHTSAYVFGGGHGVRLDQLTARDHFDCSSSTSWVLHRAGLFPPEYAWVSGEFASQYGKPGRGNFFTVWANAGHVWIQIHKHPPIAWRLDTSPQSRNDNRSGPRLRLLPRFTFGFTARHWPGL